MELAKLICWAVCVILCCISSIVSQMEKTELANDLLIFAVLIIGAFVFVIT